MQKYNPLDLLPHIDPGRCSYQEWLTVGMALHAEGCSPEDWDRWSQADPARYHPGECQQKWRSFSAEGPGVTGGSLVALARAQGGLRPSLDAGRELGWDALIREPADDWDPKRELITYLEALFEPGDHVSYVTETWEQEGRFLPKRGASDRTAGELIAALRRCRDITDVIGTVNEQSGAWIRFNPMDGRDVRNDNVTAFNYALVESDSQDIATQYALLRQMQLPIRVLVHSGGKSLHAIVHIGAGSAEEYRARVEELYAVCRKNGLEIDGQNKNPSRLSRLPGVMRRGKRQYIVARDMGQPSFGAWRAWLDANNDDLPRFESMADHFDAPPPLKDELIAGCLRQGHKMLLSGPSKAGKSLALMALTIAIAEGRPWMGMPCRQGRVLYINLELDSASCWHRFKRIYEALGVERPALQNVDVWNLRGHSLPLDRLTPKLINRAKSGKYSAVIIDPIYKIITGDENSAEEMAHFCNQFDRLCTELQTAVIYCHHHSKGAQGGKKAQDRASGSGVFARDPDAILDMIELEMTDGALRCLRERNGVDADQLTAWRIEATLREFPKTAPINVWLDYPLHRLDDTGILASLAAEEALPPWQKAAKARTLRAAARKDDGAARFAQAVKAAKQGEPPTVRELAQYLGIAERTCRDRINRYGFTIDDRTKLVVKSLPSSVAGT